jgi:hypothetical protein
LPERVKYVSSDGALTFIVQRDEQDITLGFEGYPSHTHGDIEAALSGLPVEEAVAQFLNAILTNQAIIAMVAVDGCIRDVWITSDPDKPDPWKPDNETVSFRYWDGTAWPMRP